MLLAAYALNRDGRGPAWANSLFEDNAEFGLGMRLALNKQTAYARELVHRLTPAVGDELAAETVLKKPYRIGEVAARIGDALSAESTQ